MVVPVPGLVVVYKQYKYKRVQSVGSLHLRQMSCFETLFEVSMLYEVKKQPQSHPLRIRDKESILLKTFKQFVINN